MKRPWCCADPRCTPVYQVKDSDYPDIAEFKSGESFFCWGMMPEGIEFVFDGNKHANDLRSCSFTPLKGLISMQENVDDWAYLEIGYGRALRKVFDIREAARKQGERA